MSQNIRAASFIRKSGIDHPAFHLYNKDYAAIPLPVLQHIAEATATQLSDLIVNGFGADRITVAQANEIIASEAEGMALGLVQHIA